MKSFTSELTHFALRLLSLMIIAPIAGYSLLVLSDLMEKAWKTNNRKKKWLALTILFTFIAVLFCEWLH